MKYRRLSLEELEALKDEFIQFLSANSVTAHAWVNLKAAHPEKAEELIGLFSDIVWEKVIQKTDYLEIRRRNGIQLFAFRDEVAEMIQITVQDPEFDFRKDEDISALANGSKKLESLKPTIHRGKKTYTNSRKEEVYYQLERGGVVAGEGLWELMNRFLP
jgi:hypothetical protein